MNDSEYYHGPIDGVIGPRTIEALEKLGTSLAGLEHWTTELSLQMQRIAAGIEATSNSVYAIMAGGEEDGRDHPFPVSLDEEMTDAEYYWYWMLLDAQDPPF